MLEKIDINKSMKKDEYKKLIEKLSVKLAYLQRECKSLNIPVMIVFEGWGASGKGTLINKLIAPLDPRGFKVVTIQDENEDEKLRPYLWRFWNKTPEKGRITIFDRSWYKRVLTDRIDGITTEKQMKHAYENIINFEEQLIVDGMVIIKLFLHISKKEQTKRFKKLEESSKTAWRVTKKDWERNKKYDEYLKINDEMLEKTDTHLAPWTIIEAMDREYAEAKIIDTVVKMLQNAVDDKKEKDKLKEKVSIKPSFKDMQEDIQFNNGVLNGIDLTLKLEKDEYKEKLKKLQSKLALLHSEMYKKRIPVICAFEGFDASGKGGAIKRLTQNIDPRGYEVIPTASPNDIEKAHHYLWRFWSKMPKAGHLAIFD